MRTRSRLIAVAGLMIAATLGLDIPRNAPAGGVDFKLGKADIALVVAVDVSRSVDEPRYRLQMDGIAQAFEDPAVLDAMLAGARGAILVTMVHWADAPVVAVPWQRIANVDDARRVASLIRAVPQTGGEFTCLAKALRFARERLADDIRDVAARFVVDVSGDGIDNCGSPDESDRERDALAATGATINGLPILVAGENDVVGTGAYRAPGFGLRELEGGAVAPGMSLDEWFNRHVIGGPGAFVLPAQGYEDFGRAIRRKFVIEISGLPSR